MAILGFLVLLAVALYILVNTAGLLCAISIFGGAGTDKAVAIVLLLVGSGLFYLAFINAPFTLTFTS